MSRGDTSTGVSDRKVDVSTFPHEPDCTEADLRYIRCGYNDYWLCRTCRSKGVKRGFRYEPYSTATKDEPTDAIEQQRLVAATDGGNSPSLHTGSDRQ